MVRIVEVGALELWEELMAVGYGRILGKVQTIFSIMWCMQLEREIVIGFSTTLGVVLLLWRNYTRNCLHVLWFRKLWFLTWLFLHLIGEVGVGISISETILMNGSWGDFILSMSISLPGFLVGRVRISWFGSWIAVVSLMCDRFILLYWKPPLFLSLGRAFGV